MEKRWTVNIYCIAIVCLLSYFELGALRSIIYRNQIILIFSLFLGVWIFASRGLRSSVTNYEVAWFAAIVVFVVFRNQYLANGETDVNILYYLLLTLLIFCMKNTTSWVSYFVKYMYYVSLLHATATIIFAFSPSLFQWYTSHFLSSVYYQEAMSRYTKGTISGLCVNYGANAAIIAVGLGIALICFLWRKRETRKRQVLPILILLAGLLFTGKRSPVILLVLAVAFIYLFSEKGRTNRKVVRVIIVVLAAVLAVYIGAMFIPQLQILIGRLMDSDDWSTLGGRTELYNLAIEMFKSNPLFGQGWNAYKLVSSDSIGKVYASQYSRMQTHNIYLQLLSETGIAGLVFIVALFIYPVKGIMHLTRQYGVLEVTGSNDVNDSVNLLSCIYIVLFFLLYGMTGNPLYDPYMYFLGIIACGGLQGYIVAFRTKF